MNRYDWEVQVKASDLNPTARLIALVLGSFGNWKEDKTVEPGEARLAKETGLDASTIATYMDAFAHSEWIRPVGKGRYNTTIYELCKVSHEATGVLAKKVRKVNRKSRDNLRKGNVVVPGSTGDYKEPDQNLVPEVTDGSSRSEPAKFPKESGEVPGTTEANQYNQEDNLEEPRTTPAAPVVPIREEPGTTTLPLTTESGDEVLYPMSGPAKKDFDHLLSNTYRSASETQKVQAKRIIEGKPGTGDFYEDVKNALRATGMEIDDVW